jgi:ATP-binding cassette subfamily B protein
MAPPLRRLRANLSTSRGLWGLLRHALGRWGLARTLLVFSAAPLTRLLRPVATGILIGSLAVSVGSGTEVRLNPVLWSMGLLFLAMLLEDVTAAFTVSVTQRVQATVTGYVRHRLRMAVTGPETIGHLENTRYRDQLLLASEGVRGMTLGAMATSILTSTVQMAQVLTFALVVAAFSVPVAIVLLAAVLLVRAVSQNTMRSKSRIAESRSSLLRQAMYLREAADSSRTAKDVRIFGLGPWLRDRFRDQYLFYIGPVWRHNDRSARQLALTYTLFAAAFGGGYGLLAYATLRGEVSVGELTTYVMAMGGIRAGMTNVSSSHQHAAGPLGALRQADQMTRTGPAPEAERAARHELRARKTRGSRARGADPVAASYSGRHRVGLAAMPGRDEPLHELRFEHVSFRYPGVDRDVLSDFTLTIEAGRSLAIVGLNGAGKSTIIKLLAGLHRPTAGRITVDGVDLTRIDQQVWRARLAILFQEFSRYELSIRDNVSFGHLDAAGRDGACERAALEAGLGGLLGKLPHGWDTVLSPHYSRGTDLSGGQWQRVALARALLATRAGARVVVLDEPTASLDVRAEAEFFQQVLGLTRGLTTILISHRFSTVRHADRIVVIDGGRVIESGTHDGLLAENRAYATLFRTQADRFRDPPRTPNGGVVTAAPVATWRHADA